MMVLVMFLMFVLLVTKGLAGSSSKPHIIVIVADDLGWNDVSYHGSPQIPTPNLDYLAKSGIMLNNYYVCPICSPSRSALMTGLYPIHTGLQHSVIAASEPWGLPLEKTILPEKLKELGYATHAVGKWHLGFFRKEYTPIFRGFDSHFGYWSGSEDYFDHTKYDAQGGYWGLDFRQNMSIVRDAYRNYSTELFSSHAANVISGHNSSEPLFLYLAFQSVHSGNPYSPLQAPPEYIARFPNITDIERRVFAAMTSAMDDGIGFVLDALRRKNMLENSVIVFTTDNGGPAAGFNNNHASNWPLRGVKHTLWEGGVRGASFVWSPLLRRTKRISRELMHITDWFPTLLHVAGYEAQSSTIQNLDGYDMWDTLSIGVKNPRTEVLLNIDPLTMDQALIVGKFKLIGGKQYTGKWNGWYGPSGRENSTEYIQEQVECGPKPRNASKNCNPSSRFCVYDLENDPCEYNNIAETHPHIRDMLIERLEHYNETAVEPGWKPVDPRGDPKYHDYVWTNWMDYEKH